jgi:hypothetical protein
MTATVIISVICLLSIVTVTIVLTIRDNMIQADIDKQILALTNKVNDVNKSKYFADRTQSNRLNKVEENIKFVEDNYVTKQLLQDGFETKSLSVNDFKADNVDANTVTVSTLQSYEYDTVTEEEKLASEKMEESCPVVEKYVNAPSKPQKKVVPIGFKMDGKSMTLDKVSAYNLSSDKANLKYATVDTGFANQFSIGTGKVDSLTGKTTKFDSGDFGTLTAKKTKFDETEISNSIFTNAKIQSAQIGDLVIDNKLSVKDFNTKNAVMSKMYSAQGEVADIKSTTATIDTLNADNAIVKTATFKDINTDSIVSQKYDGGESKFTKSTINELTNDVLKTRDIATQNVSTGTLYADFARVNGDITTTDRLCVNDSCLDQGIVKSLSDNPPGSGRLASVLKGGLSADFNPENKPTLFPNEAGINDIRGDTVINGDTSVAGNHMIGRNLSVTGNSSVDGNGVFGGSLAANSLEISGNGSYTGTLTAANLNVSGSINTTGATTTFGDISGNNATFRGRMNVTNDALFGKDISVSGNGTFTGNLSARNINVTGDVNLAGKTSFTGDITGNNARFSSLNVTNNATVQGNQTIRGRSTVDGDGSFGGALSARSVAASGDGSFGGTLTTNNLNVTGNMTYTGPITTSRITNTGDTTLNGSTLLGGPIRMSQDNPAVMIEKKYGNNNGDRYGIGQTANGEMRMYTSTVWGPASVNLSLAKADGNFTDVVKVKTDKSVNIDGSLIIKRPDGRMTSFPSTTDNKNYIRGDTQHDDNIVISGNASVGGNTTISGNASIVGSTNMNTANIVGVANVGGNTTINGTSTLNGATNINGALNVNNTATLNGITNIAGALSVNNTATVNELLVGRNNNNDFGGRISIAGTAGDNGYENTVIEGRNYGAPDKSELLLFKGNDGASCGGGSCGPDRIRLRAGEINFDVYDGYTLDRNATNIVASVKTDRIVTPKIQLGDKFLLSGVGDAHANDGWLRLFNKDNTGYYGGFAASQLYTATNVITNSDARLKKDVNDLSQEDLAKLTQLQPKKYNWKDTNKPDYGFIAQDVEQIYPELVGVGPTNYKTVNYQSMLPMVVGNIKDMKKSIPSNKQLCIEDVCIDKKDLLKLKQQ